MATLTQPNAREVALASIEGVHKRDLDQIVAAGHPDHYVDDFVAIGEFHGKDGVRAFFAELFDAMPDFELTVEHVVADERTAAVKWRASGTFTGAPFQGIRATGRPVQLRGVDFFEIEDGLIRRNTVFYDGATFARQIGMLPPQGSLPDRVVLRLFNLKTRITRPFRR
ncbi:MAG TPA: ester cyclase [Thermoleophilaceae bacterium]